MTADKFFADLASADDDGRDRYGRPLIVPAGMPEKVKVPYTRASSYADRVDDKKYIYRWEQRYLARAMADPANLDLLERAAGEIYTTGYDMQDLGENRKSGRELDGIIARALDRQGTSRRADQGTAVHGLTVSRDQIHSAPKHLQPRIQSYWDCIDRHGIRVLANERFVANDTLGAAGTFDEIVEHPDYGVVTSDKKTGKISMGYSVQQAVYANGDAYDLETHTREPLESYTGGLEINRKVGLLFMIGEPDPETGDCRTDIVPIDLERAWQVALAIKVVQDELTKDIFGDALPDPSLLDQITRCRSRDQLQTLWSATKADWGTKHEAAAKKVVERFEEES